MFEIVPENYICMQRNALNESQRKHVRSQVYGNSQAKIGVLPGLASTAARIFGFAGTGHAIILFWLFLFRNRFNQIGQCIGAFGT